VVGKIRVGTSGYSYADWVGPYYPPGTPRSEYLKFYAADFSFVELNFSFYTQPKSRILERMIETTHEGFLFSIKAHRSLTHEVGEDAAEAARTFRQGIEPLVDSSRLAAVLLQFPYSFHYTPESRKHLDRVSTLLAGLPLAFEFRSSEWQRPSVYKTMGERGISLVNVDEPDLPRLPKPDDTVTGELGYIRFHGRNRANWWRGDNTSRYDYLYTSDELAGWTGRIERVLSRVKLLLIAFNNHYKSQAVKNARGMRLILQEANFPEIA
jgi:uncharacterized protein YecE (DUF72 family)